MTRLAHEATAADCTHIDCVASSSNIVGMNSYQHLGATIIHQSGDAVTLQIEPTT